MVAGWLTRGGILASTHDAAAPLVRHLGAVTRPQPSRLHTERPPPRGAGRGRRENEYKAPGKGLAHAQGSPQLTSPPLSVLPEGPTSPTLDPKESGSVAASVRRGAPASPSPRPGRHPPPSAVMRPPHLPTRGPTLLAQVNTIQKLPRQRDSCGIHGTHPSWPSASRTSPSQMGFCFFRRQINGSEANRGGTRCCPWRMSSKG